MNSSKKVAHAVGGKTARACDSCIKKRARWYCAADDGFLCQACDSACTPPNQLAHRHKRVLLKTASSLKPSNKDDRASAVFGDLSGTAGRTPRGGKSMTHHGKSEEGVRNLFPQVPEVGGDDINSYDEENKEDQQLLYRVPIFDPFVAELCNNSGNSNEDAVANYEANNLSTMKLEEDDDQEGTDDVDFMGCQLGESEIDMMREPFALNFEDYDDSPASGTYSKCSTEDHEREDADDDARDNSKKRKMILRLDYEAVITAWDGSPWTSGDRPDFDSECLPDYMVFHPARVDGGREARVSRYREKRRTRLFSKKIRYEVRKLNAEKRPRMKGRFVKRASFAGSAFPVLAK
ncbi:zinc finger protein CONSTANS-LIKE 6-like [Pyrus ussuriensis x Pyrus communis]|uniref:Zinc finger protein CONSTANS-LIKE 6-like n=1 Tax=Pyrus ussuriensis x Pyrus communis TaxID=2448454 RepID=A0A5N5H9K2_9ROSA|nr:zinc finger protein CONSTANS-LIKE 6-like [Pyrus ussuriensis x Pyrus communis]